MYTCTPTNKWMNHGSEMNYYQKLLYSNNNTTTNYFYYSIYSWNNSNKWWWEAIVKDSIVYDTIKSPPQIQKCIGWTISFDVKPEVLKSQSKTISRRYSPWSSTRSCDLTIFIHSRGGSRVEESSQWSPSDSFFVGSASVDSSTLTHLNSTSTLSLVKSNRLQPTLGLLEEQHLHT